MKMEVARSARMSSNLQLDTSVSYFYLPVLLFGLLGQQQVCVYMCICVCVFTSTKALSRWMRESKTASHFVKYMVSNLSNNQNHLHEQVKQIVKAVSALQSEIRCLQDEPEGSPCFGSAVAQPSQPTIPAQFSSQNKSMCGVARSPIADNLLSSQLPTLLQRIDESSASDAPPAQPVADLGKDRMSKLLQEYVVLRSMKHLPCTRTTKHIQQRMLINNLNPHVLIFVLLVCNVFNHIFTNRALTSHSIGCSLERMWTSFSLRSSA